MKFKSIQPRKQRKRLFTAPKHLKAKFLSAHLSKELREKYKTRSFRVRKGDTVKVMRGKFKGKIGKVERVNLKKGLVYVAGVEVMKKLGRKVLVGIRPSKLLILELFQDTRRF